MSGREECHVRDGRFVDPCETLEKAIDNIAPSFSAVKGVAQWHMTNIKERKPSRSFIGVKSKQYPKGMLFNFCPFCGTKIDAPFAENDEDAA